MEILEIRYLPKTGRYQERRPGKTKGEFISFAKVRELYQLRLDWYKSEVDSISQRLFDNKITLASYTSRIGKLYKRAANEGYQLAKPTGIGTADKRLIGDFIRTQNRKFNEFAKLISQGKLSEAQIRDRAKKYFSKANEMYEEGIRRQRMSVDYRWEARFLSIAEHCPSCIRYAAAGWVRIGTLPRVTVDCECQSGCKCFFKFSRAKVRPGASQTYDLSGKTFTAAVYANTNSEVQQWQRKSQLQAKSSGASTNKSLVSTS